MAENKNNIVNSSVSTYFTKNLQQVGFSTPTKAVLTTLKEAVDNSLDACEENGILPDVKIEIEKLGEGSSKGSDKIRIYVEDNGPGIPFESLTKAFGEFLTSSKATKFTASRGRQGLGLSSAIAYAQLTQVRGVLVKTKTKKDKKTHECIVEIDIKNNKGIIKNYKQIEYFKNTGTSVELLFDGKVQLNGEGGILTYLTGTSLVNPHLSLEYKLLDEEKIRLDRVSDVCRVVPPPTEPHPHTLKIGEFISHGHQFQDIKVKDWLKKGFSRVGDSDIRSLEKLELKSILSKKLESLSDLDYKELYKGIQNIKLLPPSTKSVVSMGEESLSKSIKRLGDVDFFAVVTRKPTICDFKPIQVEVAMARLTNLNSSTDDPVKLLRFSNFVPLQFEKAACVTTQAVESVNWKAYGLAQPKDSLPQGPYVLAISIVSPFMKFKNASKETIDGGDELLEEIRLALIQVGQRLSKHIKAEQKSQDLQAKIKHIEQFVPIIIKSLINIGNEKESRKKKLELGLRKILGKDTEEAKNELEKAENMLDKHKEKMNYEK